jgi:release factor glutamine methyltransferase
LDLCTGSGCIAVALARHVPHASVFASDISAEAVAVAQANIEHHNLDGRIETRVGDLFAPWAEQNGAAADLFDMIAVNPPYISASEAAALPATVRDFEPAAALFSGDGLDLIRRVVAESPAWLNSAGQLFMEIGCGQSPAVRELLGSVAWSDVRVYKDTAGIERVVHATRS